MGKSKKQTIGYWYYMGIHLGLSHGPIDGLLNITSSGRSMYTGDVRSNQTVYINAEFLYGGPRREGGVVGQLDVMMGAPDQTPNSYLVTQLGSNQPGYRGLFGLVFNGKVTASSPYIKPWEVQARRIFKGWTTPVWYPEKAAVDVISGTTITSESAVPTGAMLAMNPAHIVYECLTNTEWGLGYPTGKIDTASFTAAADTFHAEGMGLCMAWQRQETLQNFLQVVSDHCGAGIAEDPRTGLWRIKVIRDDYDIDTLPVFSAAAGNLVRVEKFERASITEAINELTVTFVEMGSGKESSITVHQLASIAAQNAVVAQTRAYPGTPTLDLAGRIAARDLRAASAGIARVTMIVNREAYGLIPGDVVAFAYPELGIASMALRIGTIDYGRLDSGEIRIEAVQDIFGLPDTTYVQPVPIGWTPPSRDPQASTAYALFEVPYRDLVATMGAANAGSVQQDSGYVAGIAQRAPGMGTNYELWTRVGAVDYAQTADGDWAPTATLAVALTRTSTTAQLQNVINLDAVEVDSAVMIGTEICRIDAIDTGTNTITIARGCIDTIPQPWAVGTRVWFYEGFAAPDTTEYAATETVDAKFRTSAPGGLLSTALSPGASVTIARRAARPYPPGQFKLNAISWPAAISGTLAVSWAHRDRGVQQDTLVDHDQPSIGPEPGVNYVLKLYDDTGTLRRTETLTSTSYVWTTEAADSNKPGDVALLALDGTNGSTTFTDASGRAWLQGGGAQISTAQSKFGGASLALDGAADWIETNNSADFYFGSGQFTVECFVRFAAATTSAGLISKWSSTPALRSWALFMTGGSLYFRFSDTGTTLRDVGAAWSPTVGQWYHVAATRDASGVVRVFVDGAVLASGSMPQAINDGSNGVRIGVVQDFVGVFDVNGHIDMVRISAGVARYTGAFTPPASALTYQPRTLNTQVRVVLEAQRASYSSWQAYDYTVPRV